MESGGGPAGVSVGHGHESLRPTFEQALSNLKDNVLRLGALVERAVERAARALVERDVELADQVRWEDAAVNELQRSINQEITSLIARRISSRFLAMKVVAQPIVRCHDRLASRPRLKTHVL